tara:strand:- start:283 stop:642 length:360 start_codon:yes stop_codon:yes gene_type:complete
MGNPIKTPELSLPTNGLFWAAHCPLTAVIKGEGKDGTPNEGRVWLNCNTKHPSAGAVCFATGSEGQIIGFLPDANVSFGPAGRIVVIDPKCENQPSVKADLEAFDASAHLSDYLVANVG